ncbi:hypothetical protein K438DRAFT_1771075 [Mycena galopus ATCC 62051]|nr:hypothetical protein K438DRAFT_1771075 [Mycena galopus ATCC 62051]
MSEVTACAQCPVIAVHARHDPSRRRRFVDRCTHGRNPAMMSEATACTHPVTTAQALRKATTREGIRSRRSCAQAASHSHAVRTLPGWPKQSPARTDTALGDTDRTFFTAGYLRSHGGYDGGRGYSHTHKKAPPSTSAQPSWAGHAPHAGTHSRSQPSGSEPFSQFGPETMRATVVNLSKSTDSMVLGR